MFLKLLTGVPNSFDLENSASNCYLVKGLVNSLKKSEDLGWFSRGAPCGESSYIRKKDSAFGEQICNGI